MLEDWRPRALLVAALLILLPGVFPACGRLAPYGAVRDRDAAREDSWIAPPPFEATGGRASVPPPPAGAGTREASVADRVTPPAEGGATPGDSGNSRDAIADVHDANTAPDCRCPTGDFYVDANVSGTQAHLSSPFQIGLYCDETAPQLANPACGSVLRLSACAGPQNGPPCLYLTVDGQTPITGFFLDATGHTFSLVSGEISLQSTSERLAIGTFSANYASQTSEASVIATGSFHACTVLFQPCKP